MAANILPSGFFSKLLQILEEAPEIYGEIECFIEAADWVIWQLTGVMTRNTCTAGYKMLVQDGQYPSSEYFGALHPDFKNVIAEKVPGDWSPLGGRAGSLTDAMAEQLGLPAGIAGGSGECRCSCDRTCRQSH